MKKRNLILAFAIVLTGAAVFTLAMTRKITRALPPAKPVQAPLAYDTAVLRKFTSLLQEMDFNKKSFLYEGKYEISDGKDSANNVHNLSFLYAREGKLFFSKVGEDMVINDDGANVYIEHDTKRIVFSNQKFNISPVVSSLARAAELARAEQYTLEKSGSAGFAKISLINEHHISCKELSVTYDTTLNKLQKVFVRYSDVSDPLNKAKERRVEIDVDKIADNPHIGRYPGVKDVLKETNGKLQLKEKYSGYELITL